MSNDAIGEQIAIAFRGGYMFIAICRVRSMFKSNRDEIKSMAYRTQKGEDEVIVRSEPQEA